MPEFYQIVQDSRGLPVRPTTLERFIGARPYIIIKGTLSNSEFRCETAALKFSMKNDDVAN